MSQLLSDQLFELCTHPLLARHLAEHHVGVVELDNLRGDLLRYGVLAFDDTTPNCLYQVHLPGEDEAISGRGSIPLIAALRCLLAVLLTVDQLTRDGLNDLDAFLGSCA